jgi:DNA polymerase
MHHTPTRLWRNTPVSLPYHPERASIDFEGRSASPLGGPKSQGAWKYAKHKSTRILCLAFLLPGQDPLRPSLWAPPMGGWPAFEDYPLDDAGRPYDLERLFEYIRRGGLIEAHNANFEALMWQHIAVRPMAWDETGATGLGAPPVKDSQWRCSAAKCAALALPRDLEGAGFAMDLPFHLRKNPGAGKRFIERYCKPRKARKDEPKFDANGEPIVYWHDYDREEFVAGYRYCQQDVTAEHALSEMTPDLDAREQAVWLADFRANRRGVRVDAKLVDMAIRLEADLKAEMNKTLEALTGIEKGTARAQVLAWLADRGFPLPDSTAPTLDHLMESDVFKALPAGSPVVTVVHIARNINRTSVSKFKRIRDCMDPDDHRVRELVMYHGATTGRWSGKGIQVQNFPKGVISDLLGIEADHPLAGMAAAVADVMTGDLSWLKLLYGDVLSLLSSVLRGALIPSPGKVFYVADYSAIEARVVLWLAGAKQALEVFRRGGDIYMDMATGIYGYPVTDKKRQKAERAFGKVAVLGLGYGMGYLTFLLTLRSYSIKFTRAKAMEIMGDKAEKYLDWVHEQLWPAAPDRSHFKTDEKYGEAMRSYKTKLRTAAMNLQRLRDEREDPHAILEELALCKFTVDAYRRRYPEVKQLWADQEAAACRAVALWKRAKAAEDSKWEEQQARGKKLLAIGRTFECYREATPLHPVECGKVTWVVEEDRWLFCYLPSGRRIAYNCPDVKGVKTPWGESRLSLRFMGVHKKTRKWARMSSYGGSLVENIDQATARDMMADALVRIDESDEYADKYAFDLIASIHDEALSEGDDYPAALDEETGRKSYPAVKHYEGLMERLEPCYGGCPVAAEGDRLLRYQK